MSTHEIGINGATAAALRARRAAVSLSQDQVAERSGIPLVSVQRYLNAKRPIDVEVLDKLARAMGTDAQTILVQAVAYMAEWQAGD